VQRDHDVRRLEVAVDDPLLVSVLNRLADTDEQRQALAHGQVILIAEIGNGNTATNSMTK